MTPKILGWMAAAVFGALDAASPAVTAQQRLGTAGRAAASVPTSTADPAGAYTEGRWIGLARASGDCPPTGVPGWGARQLLAQALQTLAGFGPATSAVAAADRALLHELALDRFCVYTAAGPGGLAPFSIPRARGVPALLAAQRDRMALAGSGGDLDETVSPVLAETFLSQAGIAPMPLAGGSGNAGEPRPAVRLTFIDDQPDGDGIPVEPPPDGPRHGWTLMQLARRFVCPDPAHPTRCLATIASRRALNYSSFDPGRTPLPPAAAAAASGRIGLVSDLAAAIVGEVVDWRLRGGARHLILNLSLGWDGELWGDLDARRVSDLEPSVQAVYAALRFAERRGVLVVAAAGNRRSGPLESGSPLLPAAWELRRPEGAPFGRRSRPTYAVGGVDWQGLPLPNSRRGGLPQRVAYGDHAVAVEGGHPTGIYTGTSVSTAVVSAVAAVIWGLRPELGQAQVMEWIERSADRLETRASFYSRRHLWPLSRLLPAPYLRRVSLCAAVALACGADAARCPALAAPPVCHPWDRQPPQLSKLFDPAPAGAPFHEGRFPPNVTPPCDPRMRLFTIDRQVPAFPCPDEEFASVDAQRWVLPQPGGNPCPGCCVNPSRGPGAPFDYQLEMQLKPEWLSSLIPPTAQLDINCGAGRSLSYSIPFALKPNLQLTGHLGDGASLQRCTAKLTFAGTPHDPLHLEAVPITVMIDPGRP